MSMRCCVQGRYGEPAVRRAVPLAIALCSVSNPQLAVIDVLNKYSHDSDNDVAYNAIFAMGLVGAGTNNARLTMNLYLFILCFTSFNFYKKYNCLSFILDNLW